MNELDALLSEREAIIARMDLTRTRYRAEMLINRRLAAAGYGGGGDLRFAHDVQSEHFPRSMTFRILTRYKLALAGAALGLWMMGPRPGMRGVLRAALAAAPGILAQGRGGALARLTPLLLQWLAPKTERRAAFS